MGKPLVPVPLKNHVNDAKAKLNNQATVIFNVIIAFGKSRSTICIQVNMNWEMTLIFKLIIYLIMSDSPKKMLASPPPSKPSFGFKIQSQRYRVR